MKYLGPQQKLRYLRQRDKCSCGPIALLNSLKWAGYDITYARDFSRAFRACKCIAGKDGGTEPNDFNRVIRRYKKLLVLPEKVSFESPPIKLIDEHLDDNGAVVLSYFYRYFGLIKITHLTLCIGRKGKQYVFVNNVPIRTVTLVRRKTLVKMLRFGDKDIGKCEAWFLNREDAP